MSLPGSRQWLRALFALFAAMVSSLLAGASFARSDLCQEVTARSSATTNGRKIQKCRCEQRFKQVSALLEYVKRPTVDSEKMGELYSAIGRTFLYGEFSYIDSVGFGTPDIELCDKALKESIEDNKSSDTMNFRDFAEVIYEPDRDIVKNYKMAFTYLDNAYHYGDAEAALALAHMYALGEGVLTDATKALEFARVAAKRGSPAAPELLGSMYGGYFGAGVGVNKNLAYMWYNIASALENPPESRIHETLAILSKDMSTKDVAHAQELSRQCVESKFEHCGD